MGHEPYIRIVPDSDTAVLMVHGIAGTPRHFDGLLAAINETWTVYNILLEGHGGSAADFSHASMEAWRRQVRGALDELCGKYEKVFVVAHSMGTLLTIDAYAAYGDKLSGIFFLASPLKIGVKPYTAVYALQAALGFAKEGSRAELMQRDCGIELTKKLWVYLGWIPRYLELFRLVRECRPLVKDILQPCVAIQSKHDELVSRRAMNYLMQNPHIKIYELEKSGHFGYVPEEQTFINEKLKDLFEGVRK